MEYEKMHDFSLFVEYETATYNVFFMRHNFAHGNCGDMTEEQFKKLDRENMKKVLPSFDEINRRVGEENFKDWYHHQRAFWDKLDGNSYDKFCKIEMERKSKGDGANNDKLEKFLQSFGYVEFKPAEPVKDAEKTKS